MPAPITYTHTHTHLCADRQPKADPATFTAIYEAR